MQPWIVFISIKYPYQLFKLMMGPIFFRTTGILVFLFFSGMLYAQGISELPHFKTDADKDSRISYAEFYKGMDSALLFEKWDSSCNGVLDRQELYDIMQEHRKQAAGAVVLEASYAGGRLNSGGRSARQERETGELQLLRSFFRLADLNRDHRLNKTEFYLFLFRQYDADENGSLLLSEYTTKSLQ